MRTNDSPVRTLAAGLVAAPISAAILVFLASGREATVLPLLVLAVVSCILILVFGLLPLTAILLYLVFVVNLEFIKFEVVGQVLHADLVVSACMLVGGLIAALRGGYRFLDTTLQRSLALLLLLFIPSVILSVSLSTSLRLAGRFASYVVLVTVITWVKGSAVRHQVIWAVCLSSVIPCLIGLYALVTGDTRFLLDAVYFYGQFGRVQSTLSHPATFATFLMIVLTVQLSTWRINHGPIARLVVMCLVALSGLSLALTYTRGPLIGAAAALVATLVLLRRARLLPALAIVVVLALLAVPSLAERWTDILDPSSGNSLLWRIQLWVYALGKVGASWFAGSGLGTFVDYVQFSTGFAAHNMYVGYFVETGILGLGGVLVFLVVVARESWRLGRTSLFPSGSDACNEATAVALWASLVGVAVAGLAGSVLNLPSATVYFFALVGLLSRQLVEEHQRSEVLAP